MTLTYIILLVFLSALFSGSETAFYSLNPVRFRYNIREGGHRARFLAKALQDNQVFIFTLLFCNNLTVYLVSSIVTNFYLSHMGSETVVIWGFIPWSADMAASLSLLAPMFLFAEAIPKNFMRQHPQVLYSFGIFLRLLVIIWYPFSWLMKQLANLLMKGSNRDFCQEIESLTMRRLKNFLKTSNNTGVISKSQSKMINNVVDHGREDITTIMTPIKFMISTTIDSSVDSCREIMQRDNLKTLPVFSANKRELIGSFNYLDLIAAEEGGETLIADRVKPISAISSKISIAEAFHCMQKNHYSEVVVRNIETDETVGLVKLKSIILALTK